MPSETVEFGRQPRLVRALHAKKAVGARRGHGVGPPLLVRRDGDRVVVLARVAAARALSILGKRKLASRSSRASGRVTGSAPHRAHPRSRRAAASTASEAARRLRRRRSRVPAASVAEPGRGRVPRRGARGGGHASSAAGFGEGHRERPPDARRPHGPSPGVVRDARWGGSRFPGRVRWARVPAGVPFCNPFAARSLGWRGLANSRTWQVLAAPAPRGGHTAGMSCRPRRGPPLRHSRLRTSGLTFGGDDSGLVRLERAAADRRIRDHRLHRAEPPLRRVRRLPCGSALDAKPDDGSPATPAGRAVALRATRASARQAPA